MLFHICHEGPFVYVTWAWVVSLDEKHTGGLTCGWLSCLQTQRFPSKGWVGLWCRSSTRTSNRSQCPRRRHPETVSWTAKAPSYKGRTHTSSFYPRVHTHTHPPIVFYRFFWGRGSCCVLSFPNILPNIHAKILHFRSYVLAKLTLELVGKQKMIMGYFGVSFFSFLF